MTNLSIGEVVIREDPTGLTKSKWTVVKWAKDAPPVVVGTKLYTLPPTPINMVLHCPACGRQHIDAPDPAISVVPITSEQMAAAIEAGYWSNPPHRSHLCHDCGHIWRSADVPTNGVAVIKTRGKYDSSSLILDVFDEHDLCDSFAGLPVEFFNPGPSFA